MSDFFEPKSQKALFGNITVWIIASVLLIGALSIGLWAFGVFTSNIKGAGEAIKIKNAAVNRIQKQENFVQENEDYTGYLIKIKIAKQALAVLPANATSEERQVAQANVTGVQQQCVDTAQQYDADSQKYTARDFKSAGLPYRLDPERCMT